MIKNFVDLLIYNWIGLDKSAKFTDSLHFFIYDSLKIIILLSIMIFFISIIRSFFRPERIRSWLSHEKKYVGNVMASLLGVVSPFCSCSTVPIFVGFLESGVYLGVTFSFLITSPIVNEVALVLLYSLFGWKIGTLYLVSGILIGVLGGIIIDKLNLEGEVEEYIWDLDFKEQKEKKYSWNERIEYAKDQVKEIVGRIWKYVLIGIAIGAIAHGYIPSDFIIKYAGSNNPFSVLIAVVIGIPLYSNAAGMIPVVQVLLSKGVEIGTALSLMMAVTALSLPELIILRKVIKPKLLAIFITVVGVSIIFIGYIFNFIM